MAISNQLKFKTCTTSQITVKGEIFGIDPNLRVIERHQENDLLGENNTAKSS